MVNKTKKPDMPPSTTHVWTPAIETPIVGFVLRRAYYKKVGGTWKSYSEVFERWVNTYNPPEWFDTETKAGYFVPVEQFTSPDFVMIKEIK